ncbi:hypothetical protein Pat9b_3304 [Pantoea sp. At-9b]|nr:hypothetical protein Pat9b_3304 [Pantoea sp. At-9b]
MQSGEPPLYLTDAQCQLPGKANACHQHFLDSSLKSTQSVELTCLNH